MAPVDSSSSTGQAGILQKLKALYTGEEENKPAVMNTSTATCVLIFYTILYVAPFYLSPSTRPSATLNRDSPTVIRSRISSVTFTCILCAFTTLYTLASQRPGTEGVFMAFHYMGFFPLGLMEVVKTMGLTALLFLGPLFEFGVVDGGFKRLVKERGRGVVEELGSWTGYRNFVAGPITEEVLFRACAIPLYLLSRTPSSTITLLTPMVFGLAHVHHFYEFRVTNPDVPVFAALFRSVFQFGFTTIFGAYATFIFLRTGSLTSVILIHTFCNFMGLPRFWGRVGADTESFEYGRGSPHGNDSDGEERKLEISSPLPLVAVDDRKGESGGSKRNDDRGIREKHTPIVRAQGRKSGTWTVAYYCLLVLGAVGFYKQLWLLTESEGALVMF